MGSNREPGEERNGVCRAPGPLGRGKWVEAEPHLLCNGHSWHPGFSCLAPNSWLHAHQRALCFRPSSPTLEAPCVSGTFSWYYLSNPTAFQDQVEMLLPCCPLTLPSLHLLWFSVQMKRICSTFGQFPSLTLSTGAHRGSFQEQNQAWRLARNSIHNFQQVTNSDGYPASQSQTHHPCDPGACSQREPYPFKRRQVFRFPGSPHPSYSASET